MLADAVLVFHFAVVLFIAGGLPLIYAGAALRWAWVRDWRWRALHVGAIVFVAAVAVVGVTCPLTVWEDALRGQGPGGGFVDRWIHRIMFYDLPAWIFTAAYLAFAALVVVTWLAVPPTRHRRTSSSNQSPRH